MASRRGVLHHRMAGRSRAGRLGEVVAIVGAGPIAQRLLRGMNSAHGGPRVFGVYDDEASHLPQRCMGHAILGSVDDLVRDARSHLIDTVIVALPSSSDLLLVETLNKLSLVSVDVKLCPGEFAMRLGALQATHIGGHTFLNVTDLPAFRGTTTTASCCIPTMPPWRTGCSRRSTTSTGSTACRNALSRLAATVSTG